MKFATLSYSKTNNLGDQIQSLAAEQHLPRVDGFVDRDDWTTDLDTSDGVVVIMQGWFTYEPAAWPPPEWLRPVFVGFHLTTEHGVADAVLARPGVVDYLRRHEPIGCRDVDTVRRLERVGVAAEYTGCLTTTFPRRADGPTDGQRILVDVRGVALPRHLSKGARRTSHTVPRFYREHTKRSVAEDLLAYYRDRATRIVTTRLHCALPCSAMGIPTVLLANPADPRLMPATEIMEITPWTASGDLRNPLAKVERRRALRAIEPALSDVPDPRDLGEQRRRLVDAVATRLRAIGGTPPDEARAKDDAG